MRNCPTCSKDNAILECPACYKQYVIPFNKQRDLRIAERVKDAVVNHAMVGNGDVRDIDLSKIIEEADDV